MSNEFMISSGVRHRVHHFVGENTLGNKIVALWIPLRGRRSRPDNKCAPVEPSLTAGVPSSSFTVCRISPIRACKEFQSFHCPILLTFQDPFRSPPTVLCDKELQLKPLQRISALIVLFAAELLAQPNLGHRVLSKQGSWSLNPIFIPRWTWVN